MEEEFKTLIIESKTVIAESQSLLKKLRRILNIMIVVASVLFIPFLYSFIEIQVRLHDLQNQIDDTMPSDKIYENFVQKTDALAVHMYEQDWVNTQLYKITHDDTYKDRDVKILIEKFFEERYRGN